VTVTCNQGDNVGNIQLTEVGILTIIEHCRPHTTQVVLTPNRHIKSTHYLNFIPPVDISTSIKLAAVNRVKLNNLLIHQSPIIKLTEINDYSKTIKELESVIQGKKDKNLLQLTSGIHTKIIIILGIIVAYNLFNIYKNKRKYNNHKMIIPRVEVTILGWLEQHHDTKIGH